MYAEFERTFSKDFYYFWNFWGTIPSNVVEAGAKSKNGSRLGVIITSSIRSYDLCRA